MPPQHTFTSNLTVSANKQVMHAQTEASEPQCSTLWQTVGDVSRKATKLSTPVHRN